MKIAARADPTISRQRVVEKSQRSNHRERMRSSGQTIQRNSNGPTDQVSPLPMRCREFLREINLLEPACAIQVKSSEDVRIASNNRSFGANNGILFAANTASLIGQDPLFVLSPALRSVETVGAKMLSPEEVTVSFPESASTCETVLQDEKADGYSSKDCHNMANINKSSFVSGISTILAVASAVSLTQSSLPTKVSEFFEKGIPQAYFENPVGKIGSIANVVHLNYGVLLFLGFVAVALWAGLFKDNFSKAMGFAKEKLSGVLAIGVALVEWAVLTFLSALTYLKVWFARSMEDNPLKTSFLTPSKNCAPKTAVYVAKLAGGNVPKAGEYKNGWLGAVAWPVAIALFCVALFAQLKYDAFGFEAAHIASNAANSSASPSDLVPSMANSLPGDYAASILTTSPATPASSEQVAATGNVVDLSAPIAGSSSL